MISDPYWRETHGGNAGGKDCVFPFKYKSEQFESCLSGSNTGILWCGTTSNYDADGKWGYCKLKGKLLSYLLIGIKIQHVTPAGILTMVNTSV